MAGSRQKMWANKVGQRVAGASKLTFLPPTNEVFNENVARIHLQVAVWSNALQTTPPAIESKAFRWSLKEGSKTLIPTTHQDADIHLLGETVKRVKTFTYLGSTLEEDGELDVEVTHREQSRWKNWKRVSGVVCDRRMNVKINGKVYRTMVRPALMYGAETMTLKKAQESKLDVAET